MCKKPIVVTDAEWEMWEMEATTLQQEWDEFTKKMEITEAEIEEMAKRYDKQED
jgi:hypothetical protein